MKKSGEIGIQIVSISEKNEVIAYFTGAKSESDMIDIQMRTQTLLSKNELKQRQAKGLNTTMTTDSKHIKKRELKLNEKLQARLQAEKSMSVNDFLMERELKLSNRNSVLQSQTFNFLKVLHLGYERIELKDQRQRLEAVTKMMKQFQEREASDRLEYQNNRFLMGSNIDVFKHSHKLADIAANRGMKRKSLLEEITSKHSSSGAGRPIIVVPASYYPGNICLQNAVKFLESGQYEDPIKLQLKSADQNKYQFNRKIGNEVVTFEVVDSVYNFTSKQWARVVCLFTNGELFQLKDWPPKEDKVEDKTQLTDQ